MAQPLVLRLQQPFEIKGFSPLIPNRRIGSGSLAWSATPSSSDWILSNDRKTALRSATGAFWGLQLANIGDNVLSFRVTVDAIGTGALGTSIGFNTGADSVHQLGGDTLGYAIGYRSTGVVDFQGGIAASGLATFTTGDVIRVDKNGASFSFYKNDVLVTTVDATGVPVAGFAYPAATNGNGTGTQLTFTSAAVGFTAINGTLSSTLDNVTLTDTANLLLKGTLAKTLGNVTLTDTANLLIKGSVVKTLGNVTLSSTGNTLLKGTLAKTLAAVTSSSIGKLLLQGSVAKTLGNATLSSTGSILLKGSLNKTLSNSTLSSTSNLLLKGSLNKTLGPLTGTETGRVLIKANVTRTLDLVTLSAYGLKVAGPISGYVTTTLANVTSSAVSKLKPFLKLTMSNFRPSGIRYKRRN